MPLVKESHVSSPKSRGRDTYSTENEATASVIQGREEGRTVQVAPPQDYEGNASMLRVKEKILAQCVW